MFVFFVHRRILERKIDGYLKKKKKFLDLPALEKAIIISAACEIINPQNFRQFGSVMDQFINFSKAYLPDGKFKYINKCLDLFEKEYFRLGIDS